MATTVNHPTLGTIEFPSEMGDADIVAAIKKLETQQSPAPAPAPAPTPAAQEQVPSYSAGNAASMLYGANPYAGNISPETQKAIAANTVRYGVPLLAAALATPETLGTGSIPAYLTASALINAGANIGAEAGASSIEGSPMTLQKLEGSGVRGLGTGVFAPGSMLLKAAGPLERFLVGSAINTTTSLGSEQLARKIENKPLIGLNPSDWNWQDYLSVGLPTVATGLSMRGYSQVKGEAERVRLAGERGSAKSVTVADVVPSLANVEAAVLRNGNTVAREIFGNIDIPISRTISKLESDPDLGIKFSAEFKDKVGALGQLQDRAAKAANEADIARSNYNELINSGAKAEAAIAKEKAAIATREAMAERAAYSQAAKKVLFESGIPVDDTVSVGAMQKAMTDTNDAIVASKKQLLDSVYTPLPIKENDQVGDIRELLAYLPKKITGLISRGQAEELLKNAYQSLYAPTSFVNGEITREGLAQLKGTIAKGLTQSGETPKNANRIAGQIYESVVDHSKDFVARKYGKDVANQMASANRLASDLYSSLDSKLMDYFRSEVKTPKAFVSQVIEEGSGDLMRNLNDFLTSVEAFGGSSKALANDLRSQVHSVVRQGLIERTLDSQASGNAFKRIDVKSLVNELTSLKNRGYPIAQLNLGKPEDLTKLSNVFSAAKNPALSMTELNYWTSLAPYVGGDVANARILFNRELKNQMLTNGALDFAQKESKLHGLKIKAKVDADTLAAQLKAIESDPVYQLLNNKDITRINLNSPTTNDLIESLLTLPETTLKNVADTLEATGRSALLKDARSSMIANVFKGFLEAPMYRGAKAGFDDAKFTRFFSPKTQEQITGLGQFKAFLSQSEYQTLEKNIIKPMEGIAKRRAEAGIVPGSELATLIKGVALPSNLISNQGVSKNQLLLGSVTNFLNLVNSQRYNLAYMMHVNPVTAPIFANIGYNVNNISRLTPSQSNKIAIAFNLANNKDSEDMASASSNQQKSPQ